MTTYTPELRAEVDAALKNIDAETETEGYGAESFSGSDLSTWERGVIIDTLFAVVAPTIDAKAERIAELEAENARLREAKDGAYMERNRLVALVASLFPSGTKRTAIEGWSDDWHGCVYIDLPSGQASWHYHDSQAWLFAHLPPYSGEWDGHTTEQKYERIAAALKDTAQ